MADKTIGELKRATSLDDDSLLIAEQQGEAVSVTGGLFKSFAQETTKGFAESASADAAAAVGAKEAAQSALKGVQDALNNLPAGGTLVINDLTTGGTTAALSAEMGKALKQDLSALDYADVGAAPAGYGYGDNTWLFYSTNDNDGSKGIAHIESVLASMPNGSIKQFPFQDFPILYGTGSGGIATVFKYNASYGHIVVEGANGIRYVRQRSPAGWDTEWSCDDPIMQSGVEYRTTERYNGKPVYARLYSYPGVTPVGYGEVAHGIANIKEVIRANGVLYDSTGDYGTVVGTVSNSGSTTGGTTANFVEVSRVYVAVFCSGNQTGKKLNVAIYYTKTTG